MKKYIAIAAVIVIALLIAGSRTRDKPTGYDTYIVSCGDTVCDIAQKITPENIDYRHTVQIIVNKNSLKITRYIRDRNYVCRNGRNNMTQAELDEILAKHTKWLNDEDGGERADLLSADLRGAKLQDTYLRDANIDFCSWPIWCGSLKVRR